MKRTVHLLDTESPIENNSAGPYPGICNAASNPAQENEGLEDA